MKMKPIRLAIVLAVYGTAVILALVAMTVTFTLLNEKTARDSATNLADTTMGRNLRLVETYVQSYENVTKQAAEGLSRFHVSGKDLGNTNNISAYESPWKVMTIYPEARAAILTVFEMWRANSSAPWYATGCVVPNSECYVYSPMENHTTYVSGNLLQGTFNFASAQAVAEFPPNYERHVDFLQLNEAYMPVQGLWSPMYVTMDERRRDSPTTQNSEAYTMLANICLVRPVERSLTFYYCMDLMDLAKGDPIPDSCLHVIASRIDASNLGDLSSLALSRESTTYALSVFVQDSTNHSCVAPKAVETAFINFIVDCGLDVPLSPGGDWDDRLRSMNTRCRNQRDLKIGRETVMMTAGVTTETGIFVVLIDVIPRSFFFALLDRGKHVSIAISVTVCVVVVVVSVLSWLAIVVPIHWICHGLHKASTLTSEPRSMTKKASRYTFIYEVDTLYKSYQELRKALTELKAFVPQGLFVAPSAQEMYSDAMLLALFGPSASDTTDGAPHPADMYSDESSSDVNAKGDDSGNVSVTSATSSNGDGDSSTSSGNGGGGGGGSSLLSTTSSSAAFSPRSVRHSQIEVSIVESEVRAHRGGDDAANRADGPNSTAIDGTHQVEMTAKESKCRTDGDVKCDSNGSPHNGASRPRAGGGSDGSAVAAASSTVGHQFSGTGSGSVGGIVKVFPISQADSILAAAAGRAHTNAVAHTRELLADAGLLSGAAEEAAKAQRRREKRKQRKRQLKQRQKQQQEERRSAATPSQKDDKPARPSSAEIHSQTTSGAGRRPSKDKDVKPAGLTSKAGKSKESGNNAEAMKGLDSTIAGAGDTPSAASLELNLHHSRINTFRYVSCSFVLLSFAFRYVDTESLETIVTELMDIVVKVILRCGGVIEIFRPDLIAASFGAHASMNRHVQFATLCAVTLMKKMPSKQRPLTRVVVDSGTFYVGNCGAHGRTARVVFGDRFDFALDLMKFDLGLGRVLCTDRIAGMLPGSFAVPVDYIVPLRNRVHGIQLFQVLNPAKRFDQAYRNGADRFRLAYGAAVSGDLKGALDLLEQGQLFDVELGQYFQRALRCLQTQTPPRPRYCRFQLPQFELLGSEMKEKESKYLYEKLALEDIHNRRGGGRGGGGGGGGANPEDTLPSINFGFGDPSSSAVGNVSHDTLDPENLSRAFFQRSAQTSVNHNVSTSNPNNVAASNAPPGGKRSSGAVPGSQSGSEHPRRGSELNTNAFPAFAASVSAAELPMTIVDHKGVSWFRMPAPIGTGAFAEVYKALSSSGTVMALKCIQLSSSNVQLADVVSEVNTACKLFNDHIVNYTGWALVGSYLVIIMDYIAGGSLHSALSAFPRGMPVQLVKRYASDALKGLAYLHRNGIVHADIKPQNILLSADGACKLGDFGSSVTKANALSCGGDVFNLRGTPQYMSPEVAAGATPTLASDLWSFGITLFEMLTGRLPWMRRVVNPAPRRPSMPTTMFSPSSPAAAAVPSAGQGIPAEVIAAVHPALAAAQNSVSNHFSLESGGAGASLLASPLLSGSDGADSKQQRPLLVGQSSPVLWTTSLPHAEAAHAATGVESTPQVLVGVAGQQPQQITAHTDPHALAPASFARPPASPKRHQVLADATAGGATGTSGTGGSSAEGVEELVEVQGTSDVRFVQGVGNGSIVVHLREEDIPTREAFELLSRCLSEDPALRPSAAEIVDHVFFLL